MQNPVGSVQTEQWSWILQTVWGWIWGGLSWILDWQRYVFQVVAGGESFWGMVAKFVLLFFRKAAVEITFEKKTYLVVPQAAILVLVREKAATE